MGLSRLAVGGVLGAAGGALFVLLHLDGYLAVLFGSALGAFTGLVVGGMDAPGNGQPPK